MPDLLLTHGYFVYEDPRRRELEASRFPIGFELLATENLGELNGAPPFDGIFEPWTQKHPRVLGVLSWIDRALCGLPIFSVIGDHMLLHCENVSS